MNTDNLAWLNELVEVYDDTDIQLNYDFHVDECTCKKCQLSDDEYNNWE